MSLPVKITLWVVGILTALTVLGAIVGEDDKAQEQAEPKAAARAEAPAKPPPAEPKPKKHPTLPASKCEAAPLPEICDIAADVLGRKITIAAIATKDEAGVGVSYTWRLPFDTMEEESQMIAVRQTGYLMRRTFKVGGNIAWVDVGAYGVGEDPFSAQPRFAAEVDGADVTGDPLEVARITRGGIEP